MILTVVATSAGLMLLVVASALFAHHANSLLPAIPMGTILFGVLAQLLPPHIDPGGIIIALSFVYGVALLHGVLAVLMWRRNRTLPQWMRDLDSRW